MKLNRLLLSILSAVSLFLVVTTQVRALTSGEVLVAVNATRTNNGIASLAANTRLQRAAAMKLADIQQYRYWAHDNPKTGADWSSFIRKTGYHGYVGENLSSNFKSTEAVISAWLNSASHKANLLASAYNEVGIAVGLVDFGKGNEVVVVAEFGGASRTSLQAKR